MMEDNIQKYLRYCILLTFNGSREGARENLMGYHKKFRLKTMRLRSVEKQILSVKGKEHVYDLYIYIIYVKYLR